MKINNKIFNVLSYVIVIVMAVFVLVKSYIPENFDVKVGDICPSDIFANGEIVDEVTTENLRKQAMDLVQPNYEVILGAKSESIAKAEKIIGDLRAGKDPENMQNIKPESSDKWLISSMEKEDYDVFLSNVKSAVEFIMTQSVSEENIVNKKEELRDALMKRGVNSSLIDTAQRIGAQCISVNVKPDYEAYEKAKKDSAASVEPIIYKKGAKVIGKGEVIEEKHYAMMSKMGYVKETSTFNIAGHLGRTVIVIIMFSLVWAYIYTRQKELYKKYFTAYSFMMIIQLLILLLFVFQSGNLSYYLYPMLMLPMLLSVLFGRKISIITNVLFSVLALLAFDSGPGLLVAGLVAGSFASVKMSKLESRSGIFKIAMATALLSFVTTVSYDAGVHSTILPAVINGLYSTGGVIVGSVVAIGLMPAVEFVFNILTPFKLAEYTNFESPLLKRMIVEAPGTYHHCLMVGNLAENAANEIGANALLTRAGAYYHDIGKLKRPQMFKENQYNDNPHDYLNAKESAYYIISHTSDGMDLAKKYKLPTELSDFIDQHHGTTYAAYFLHKAKEDELEFDEEEFRYKGRKPQSKETAIVMLADTVEAAMRTINEYSNEEIDQFITKLIKTKTDSGQFSECNISFNEIEKIKISFIYTLKGYFHQRVKYPEQNENNK